MDTGRVVAGRSLQRPSGQGQKPDCDAGCKRQLSLLLQIWPPGAHSNYCCCLTRPIGDGVTDPAGPVKLIGLLQVKFLVEKGAEVNAEDGYHNTALYHACTVFQTEMVEFLLSVGADRNQRYSLKHQLVQMTCS